MLSTDTFLKPVIFVKSLRYEGGHLKSFISERFRSPYILNLHVLSDNYCKGTINVDVLSNKLSSSTAFLLGHVGK